MNDTPGEFKVNEQGKLLFKPALNWPIEDLVVRIARIICHDQTFQPFRKNEGRDDSWVLDNGNNWWFHTAPEEGEGWYDIVYRYYRNNDYRPKLEAVGAALIWLV